jgi:hypothetical protein
VIVTNGFFFECVWWQIVTFLGYWDAAAGVRDGDTAAPIDASAPTARAVIPPTAALRPQPHLEDRVISVDSPFDPFDSGLSAHPHGATDSYRRPLAGSQTSAQALSQRHADAACAVRPG